MTDLHKLREINPLWAEIQEDLNARLTIEEIAELNDTSIAQVEFEIKAMKRFLKRQERQWLHGLQDRAANALLRSGLTEAGFVKFYKDVMSEKIDLEDFEGIGHKCATEIRRWLVKKKKPVN